MKQTFYTAAAIFTLSFMVWIGFRAVNAISFDTNCKQYLKRAADANSVEMAKEALEKAIAYAESHHLTSGTVSIFLKQPKNDLGYWYQILKLSYDELENLPADSTALEKTNVLMKLRETLTDSSNRGTKVTLPQGISIYPYNVAYFLWGLLSFIIAIICWFLGACVD